MISWQQTKARQKGSGHKDKHLLPTPVNEGELKAAASHASHVLPHLFIFYSF